MFVHRRHSIAGTQNGRGEGTGHVVELIEKLILIVCSQTPLNRWDPSGRGAWPPCTRGGVTLSFSTAPPSSPPSSTLPVGGPAPREPTCLPLPTRTTPTSSALPPAVTSHASGILVKPDVCQTYRKSSEVSATISDISHPCLHLFRQRLGGLKSHVCSKQGKSHCMIARSESAASLSGVSEINCNSSDVSETIYKSSYMSETIPVVEYI